MESWLKSCLLLCLYGFFKELRPSEPYLTEYILGPHHNLTDNQIYYDVYPVWTYSYLSQLVIVFLVTDLLRYKPVIIFEGLGYVATWSLLLWARGVHWMQFMEFCYGIATSTEVAYYTYIYAQVDDKYYQRVTSYTRCAILTGRFFSGFFAQLLHSLGLMNYHSLNYFSLVSVLISLCIAMCLPSVSTSIYFHRKDESIENDQSKLKSPVDSQIASSPTLSEIQKEKSTLSFTNLKQVTGLLWRDFKESYSNKYLVKWSIWWAFATCMNFQVGNYIQPLWESISPFQTTESIYNGAVEAASTLLGAIAAFSVGYFHLNWVLVGELTLAVISLIDALLLAFMGITSEIWVGYINYILFRVSYQVLITVASYQIAKHMRAECYGLVFGINMFLALLIQTVLTLIVNEWLEIELGLQFVIYGCYFGLLSLLFFVFSFYGFTELGLDGIRKEGLWEKSSQEEKKLETPVGQTEL